jgi:hypothetical protein
MGESDALKSIEEVSQSDLTPPGRLAVRKELRRLESLLDPDEEVVSMARGAYKGRFGLVAVTRKRVIFVDRAKIQSQTASFSVNRIRKIETGTTPMGYGRIELFLASDDLPSSEGDVPSRLRFKIVPKSKTEDLAESLSVQSGVGSVQDVGMVPDESIEAGADSIDLPTEDSSGGQL